MTKFHLNNEQWTTLPTCVHILCTIFFLTNRKIIKYNIFYDFPYVLKCEVPKGYLLLVYQLQQ